MPKLQIHFKGREKTLLNLRNIGKATLADLKILGVTRIDQLAKCEAESLYLDLQRKTNRPHDPCVWDVFSAAIHEARTGEALDWWQFTRQRKSLVKSRLRESQ